LLAQYPEIEARLDDTLSQQIIAQLDYHAEESKTREQRFQPRMRKCPVLNR